MQIRFQAGRGFPAGVKKLEQTAWKEIGRRQTGFFDAVEKHYRSAPAWSHASEKSFRAGVGQPRRGGFLKTGKKKPPIVWSGSFVTQTAAAKAQVRGGTAKIDKIWFNITSQAAKAGVWEGGMVHRYPVGALESLLSSIEAAGWLRR